MPKHSKIPLTISLTDAIHMMANKEKYTFEALDTMIRSLTIKQREQLFFTLRKQRKSGFVRSRDLNESSIATKPSKFTANDVRIIFRWYQGGGQLVDIWKIFFKDRFNSRQNFNYYVHNHPDLKLDIKRINRRRKQNAKKQSKE